MLFLSQVIEKCFVGTASRLSGVTFEILAQEVGYTLVLGKTPQLLGVLLANKFFLGDPWFPSDQVVKTNSSWPSCWKIINCNWNHFISNSHNFDLKEISLLVSTYFFIAWCYFPANYVLRFRPWPSTVLHLLTGNVTMSWSTTRYLIHWVLCTLDACQYIYVLLWTLQSVTLGVRNADDKAH